jgi:thiol-disulfide isomerase/thioredoxin
LVLELNNDNFFETVGKDKYVVVKFYTRWCGYCRQMAPEYDKLFDYYSEKRNDVVISRIEASINEDISFKYGIFSFPIVVIFRPGETNIGDVFKGQRVMTVMAEWIDKNSPTKKEELKSKQETIDENKLDQNMIIKAKINNTLVTDEIEFLRREVHELKVKIDKLEEEIIIYKKQDNQSGDRISNELNSNNVDNIKDQKIISVIEKPSIFTMLVVFVALLIVVALMLTIKRILSKTIVKQDDINHHKV